MLRDIGEIQKLATKYSKPQLAQMAQMGLIDPTKAVMAGMMIDRITKSNMQAPQQTVAEEALTPMAPPAAPPMQQAQPPVAPAGIGALPTKPEPNAGVAALPSGITEMAGGGIVAFDEGGRVPSFNLSGGNQTVYGMNTTDVFSPSYVEGTSSPIGRFMGRNYQAGVESVQAGVERARDLTAYPQGSKEAYAAQQKRLEQERALVNKLQQLEGLGFKQQTKAQQEEAAQVRNELATLRSSRPVAPVAEAPAPAPGTKATNPNYVEPPDAAPRPDPRARPDTRQGPGARQGPGVPRPTAEQPSGMQSLLANRVPDFNLDPNIGKFETVKYKMPQKKELKDYLRQQEEADRAAGVNTNIYKDLMGDLETKKGKLANRKQEAIGAALMQTGLGLLGARRGQEFAVLGEAGQRSLQGLIAANERIRDTEEKIDDARRGLLVAENDYKRTRSDKALDRVERNTERIENLEIKNVDNTNTANQEKAKIGVQLQNQGIQVQGNRIQEEGNIRQAATTLEAERMRNRQSEINARISAAASYRPSETERMMTEHARILKKDGPDAAEKYLQLQERMSGRGKTSGANLQEQYADDWNKMEIIQRKNMKEQGIANEQQYIDYRLKLAGRNPTAQQNNAPPIGSIHNFDGKKWRFKGGANTKENYEVVN